MPHFFLLSTGPLTFQIAALLVEVSPQIVKGLAAWKILGISGKYGNVCASTVEELTYSRLTLFHLSNLAHDIPYKYQSLKPLLQSSLSFEQLFEVLIEARDWPNLRNEVARRQVLAKTYDLE